jgi:predicted FMN-binding regulatory protein PaiB
MYVPDQYNAPQPSWELDIVHGFPLALLVTNGAHGPTATHVPVIVDPDAAGLTGTVLTGHMNRHNPHWDRLPDNGLLMFQGPGGYVSPAHYRKTPAAPTWNFTAVHARGLVTPVLDRAETLEVVRTTAATFERRFGAGWDMTGSQAYFGQLLPGVGAFRMTVDSVESMFKLSQEQAPDARRAVRSAFAGQDGTRRLAELMEALPDDQMGEQR